MDDSGYFSVQVIAAALNVWNLELVPYNSAEPRALDAQKSPQYVTLYILQFLIITHKLFEEEQYHRCCLI